VHTEKLKIQQMDKTVKVQHGVLGERITCFFLCPIFSTNDSSLSVKCWTDADKSHLNQQYFQRKSHPNHRWFQTHPHFRKSEQVAKNYSSWNWHLGIITATCGIQEHEVSHMQGITCKSNCKGTRNKNLKKKLVTSHGTKLKHWK